MKVSEDKELKKYILSLEEKLLMPEVRCLWHTKNTEVCSIKIHS